jgi:class 3 adenylate cyclase
MGLHTGPVTADSIPNDQRLAPTEIGETTHLAVWLQYQAEPGTLLISDATMRLVAEEVQCIATRNVHLPGHSHAVVAYTIPDLER